MPTITNFGGGATSKPLTVKGTLGCTRAYNDASSPNAALNTYVEIPVGSYSKATITCTYYYVSGEHMTVAITKDDTSLFSKSYSASSMTKQIETSVLSNQEYDVSGSEKIKIALNSNGYYSNGWVRLTYTATLS